MDKVSDLSTRGVTHLAVLKICWFAASAAVGIDSVSMQTASVGTLSQHAASSIYITRHAAAKWHGSAKSAPQKACKAKQITAARCHQHLLRSVMHISAASSLAHSMASLSHCRWRQQRRRRPMTAGTRAMLDMQGRELLAGDVVSLLCFCFYKQVQIVAVRS